MFICAQSQVKWQFSISSFTLAGMPRPKAGPPVFKDGEWVYPDSHQQSPQGPRPPRAPSPTDRDANSGDQVSGHPGRVQAKQVRALSGAESAEIMEKRLPPQKTQMMKTY